MVAEVDVSSRRAKQHRRSCLDALEAHDITAKRLQPHGHERQPGHDVERFERQPGHDAEQKRCCGGQTSTRGQSLNKPSPRVRFARGSHPERVKPSCSQLYYDAVIRRRFAADEASRVDLDAFRLQVQPAPMPVPPPSLGHWGPLSAGGLGSLQDPPIFCREPWTPISGVNCQRTRAGESNSRRGKPRPKPLCRGDASEDERKVFIGLMRDPAKPVPPPSRAPITGVAVKRARAEESNGRRGKPRLKCRFHLAFPLTKLSRNRLSTVLGWNIFLASFKLVIPATGWRVSERSRGCASDL
ncbi:hypothetical protein THAOC_28842 [Thalassiosira oceanica]|uniref:Uncharacterized protein n=1 Tax=Thalassiosira oceanica TaxID=159749 RepID=K0RI19_THAOC|nr:hypothetical protein THAOC_28842 [Thalassiosira oceanica]|eukprot:EJK51939.1 hypothetical protein THAOC_28842 [Thalassiosira oceanica]